MVYDEYKGEGEFSGKPIIGGLKGLDEKYNTKWRSGDAAYQKAYSRIKQVVSCVETRMKEQNRMREEVLQELDELFAEKECRNLTVMWCWLDCNSWGGCRSGCERAANKRPTSLVVRSFPSLPGRF
jgi:Transcriptional activator of glycolytic enzymes